MSLPPGTLYAPSTLAAGDDAPMNTHEKHEDGFQGLSAPPLMV
jgi:hypothetical protein